jgi:2-haloacid dehalogenase
MKAGRQMDGIRAITFDCYGTLIDWEAAITAFLEAWATVRRLRLDLPAALGTFADVERRHELERPFKPYPRVLHDAFLDLARRVGARSHPADAMAFASSIGAWPPFPDTLPALRRLTDGRVLGVISNVDDDSFAETHALLEGLIDEVVTAETVGAYKPAPAPFETMLARLEGRGIGREAVLHVASSCFHDILPAQRLGLATAWVDRRRGRPGRGITIPAEADPDLVVADLAELAARLG